MFPIEISRKAMAKTKWLFFCIPLYLSGCATITSLDPIPGPLQIKTVDALGVHSSSELTFVDVESDAPGSIRPQTLHYRAIKKRDGSAFDCTSQMFPGMAGEDAIYTPPKCTPVNSGTRPGR